jgi:TPR repeat protein
MELYDSLVKEGLERGYGNNYCSFSLYRTLREYIFGQYGTTADPQRVADFIKSNLGPYESEDIEVVDPAFYMLLGDAYSQLGNKNAAIEYYSKAADGGYIESFSSCLLHSIPDENSTDKAWEIWKGACRKGCDFGDPLCYFMLCTFNKTSYDDLPDEEKPKRTAEIEDCLYQSYALGDEIGALQLGYQYYYGWDGFEESDEKAWEWFSKAAYWEDGTAYAMLAQMIEDGYGSEKYDQTCANLFHLQAYRRGETDELKMVVKLYQSGYLTEFSKEIETLCIPKYEQQLAENPEDDTDEDFEDDDYEDDDGRFDAWS